MKKSKRLMVFVAAAMMGYMFTGCYKDKTVIVNTGTEVTKTVLFSTDIIPIFNKNCSLSGCHTTGGQAPDLSSSKAYTSLTNGNFLDISTPDNSELYKWMSGQRNLPMPVAGINKDNNALVLAWIKQGAKNN